MIFHGLEMQVASAIILLHHLGFNLTGRPATCSCQIIRITTPVA
jgi:hypothetical protein